MWKNHQVIMFLLIVFLVNPNTILAEPIYVSPTGSDSNPGTYLKPYLTIKKGVQIALPGDFLIVKPGTYRENIKITKGGASEKKRLVIKAEKAGTVILEGNSNSCWNDCSGYGFFLKETYYTTIEGFEIRNFENGIQVSGGGNHNFIQNILRSNSGAGIQVWKSHENLIEKCQFIDPNPPGKKLTAVQDYGVNFYHSNKSIVRNSYFFGNHNQAVSFKKNDHGGIVSENTFEGCLYTCVYLGQNDEEDDEAHLWCSDMIVKNNVFRPAAIPYRLKNAINVRNVKNVVVRNNFMEGMNAPSGHAIWVWNRQNGADNVQIYNNTAINSVQPAFRLESTGREVYTHHNILVNTAGVTVNPLNGENNYLKNDYDYNSNPAGFVGRLNDTAWPSEPDPQFYPDFSRAEAFRLKK